jgi:hypothetical protein
MLWYKVNLILKIIIDVKMFGLFLMFKVNVECYVLRLDFKAKICECSGFMVLVKG